MFQYTMDAASSLNMTHSLKCLDAKVVWDRSTMQKVGVLLQTTRVINLSMRGRGL